MEVNHNYYALLGLSPTASSEEIKTAYRKAVRAYHPDTNNAPGASLLFKDINAAYEILLDRQKRSQYDQVDYKKHTESSGLLVETIYSRSYLRKLEEPQLLYVLLKLQPVLERSSNADAPLNICMVIDRSTSMQGERLHNVKQAAHQLVDNLKPDDIISIVTFSDKAEVLISARKNRDPANVKARISMLRASGATAIYAGLNEGLRQLDRYRDDRYINHMVLITDGRTYGDEEDCMALSARARERGISISGMGIGEDWNDYFLDELTSKTGGSSAYISSPRIVTQFLREHIKSLATAYAERAHLIAVPTANVTLNSIMRLSPESAVLPLETQPLALGNIDGSSVTSLMLQFHVTTSEADVGEYSIGRVDVGGEVLGTNQRDERIVRDLMIEITEDDIEEEPPPEILDALSRLMLYRLQDKAREAVNVGEPEEATRRLEILATRLFEHGQNALGQTALFEAQQVASTQAFSEEGAKQLKYGTRAILFTDDDDY